MAKPAACQVAMARVLVATTKLNCIARKPRGAGGLERVLEQGAGDALALRRGRGGVAGVGDVGAAAALVRAEVGGAEDAGLGLGDEDPAAGAGEPVVEGGGAAAVARHAEDLAGGADRVEDRPDGVVVGRGWRGGSAWRAILPQGAGACRGRCPWSGPVSRGSRPRPEQQVAANQDGRTAVIDGDGSAGGIDPGEEDVGGRRGEARQALEDMLRACRTASGDDGRTFRRAGRRRRGRRPRLDTSALGSRPERCWRPAERPPRSRAVMARRMTSGCRRTCRRLARRA